MKTILISLIFFLSVSISQGTKTDIEAMNDMNRQSVIFDHNSGLSKMVINSELELYAMEDVKKKRKKGKKIGAKKGKKSKKGFFSKIFGSK